MTQPGSREALIVAVSEYHDPRLRRLRAPAADAEHLAEVLGDPEIGGFRVEVLTDPEEGLLRRQLATFFRAERRPEDLLLVHFSCHGVKDASGELYFAATDTEKDLLDATAIDATWLNRRISRCRSKRIVVLLDCCYSGSFPFGAHPRADEDVNAPAHLDGRGRAVITASSSMEYAYEGDQLTTDRPKPSVFTDAVVEGLRTGEADRDHDKLISVQDLYDYVYDRVRETTPDQTPNMMSSLEGPLYIARSKYERPDESAVLAKTSQEPNIRGLIRLWHQGGRGRSVQAGAGLERIADAAGAAAAAALLIEGDAEERAAAAAFLAEPFWSPSPQVVAVLGGSDDGAVSLACGALIDVGPAAVPLLLAVLDELTGPPREAVVGALVAIGTPAALFGLAERLIATTGS